MRTSFHRPLFDRSNKTSVEQHKLQSHSYDQIRFGRHPVLTHPQSACFQMDSDDEPLIVKFICVRACVQTCCLLQALAGGLKKIPSPWGDDDFTSVQNTRWNLTEIIVPYILIFMTLDRRCFFTICNPAIDYFPSLYSVYEIACPMRWLSAVSELPLSGFRWQR